MTKMTTDSDLTPEPEVNTANEFLLSSREGGTVVAPMYLPVMRSRQAAYRLAAWCALMGETLPDEEHPHTLQEIVQAIRNT